MNRKSDRLNFQMAGQKCEIEITAGTYAFREIQHIWKSCNLLREYKIIKKSREKEKLVWYNSKR